MGVLSPDIREHLNAYLLLPLFEQIDRNRFDLFVYSLVEGDGSAIRSRIERSISGVRDLSRLGDDDAAAAIRADDIDILLDVGGHTSGGRFAITARRPARLQASYLGFAGSLGARCVDFAIIDRIAGLGSDQLTITPGVAGGNRFQAGSNNLTTDDALAIAELPNVKAVVPQNRGNVTLRAGNVSVTTSGTATWPNYAEALNWPVASGTFINQDDVDT